MAIKVAGQEVISDTRKITGGTALDLTPIEATIADTAVDVFVYDTRKDSDGGSWRLRCQHTSWYNETLNTATRGARREFPAVAVLVLENLTSTVRQLTIYDGDDPDLPMWMVFKNSTSYYPGWTMLTGGSHTMCNASSVAALNGEIYVGLDNGPNNVWAGLQQVSFIKDEGHKYGQGLGYYFGKYPHPIAKRAVGIADNGWSAPNTISIVNYKVNDIAMTVLPNAPIDPATQLPIPTIAVATDGGVSVIKDDGSVVDIKVTSTMTGSTSVYFLPDNRIAFNAQQSSVSPNYYRYCIAPIPSSDVSNQAYWQSYADDVVKDYAYSDYTGEIPLFPNVGLGANITAVEKVDNDHAIGGPQSLSLLSESSIDNSSKDLFAYITSTYNTGWMNGDIKLATLSDTDATNVTGTELATVSSGTTDGKAVWSLNSATQAVVSGFTALSYADGINSNLTIGKTYTITLTVSNYSGSGAMGFGALNGVGSDARLSANGTVSSTFVATGTNLQLFTLGGLGTMDITIRLAEEDRSVNGNGLQVFGTVTKTPVATGADLVAYSGFSTSNYLEQPYNSDLDVGTGDFCVMGWAKTNTTTPQVALFRSDGTPTSYGTGAIWQIELSGDFKFILAQSAFNNAEYVTYPAGSFATGTWRHFVALRSSGTLMLYIDGVLVSSVASGNTATNTNAHTKIGERDYSTRPWLGSLALMRISGTAPTAEQIAKIYEDEKVLFQEGAQATLYGSSDAVTALAYDDTTDLLHVGTSAGRSDFSGLRRVSNTTDAVGTAISASNGMIVEE